MVLLMAGVTLLRCGVRRALQSLLQARPAKLDQLLLEAVPAVQLCRADDCQSLLPQVVLAIPDREESRAFLARAVTAGLAFRFVRRCLARPDLPTPVSICQIYCWRGPDPGGGARLNAVRP